MTRRARSASPPLRRRGAGAVLVVALLFPVALGAQEPAPGPGAGSGPGGVSESVPVIVASKPFAESYLLAELFAQRLEAVGIPVDRRPGLGATDIAFRAVRSGEIDLYPEYTGTGLVAVLGGTPEGDARDVFDLVSSAFSDRWGVGWLPPLGFENSYAIAIRPETADSLGLRTLSDLAALPREVGERLIGGFSPDFIGRPDGLEGLRRAYGLALGDTCPLLQAVKYEALAAGEVDIIDGYTTDGAIARYDLVVLGDDRGFFPPYEAAALVRPGFSDERPDAVVALVALSGRLDEERIRAANRRVEVDGVSVTRVASDLLGELGLGGQAPGGTTRSVDRSAASLPAYLWSVRERTLRQTLRHLWLVGLSLLGAILVAVPTGVALARRPGVAEPTVRAIGILQTLPSIALLAFMIPLLGIGVRPAVVALFLYALFPIVRNTWTGIRDADPEAVEAARALGMTETGILMQVRLPLAAPVIMAGIRVAAVIAVGTATLAAFIGAGGLGDPIVSGLALSDTRMILSGAIPAALLALAVDALLSLVEGAVRPRGLAAD